MIATRVTAASMLVLAVAAATAQNEPAQAGAQPSDAEIAAWFKFRQSKWAELHAASANQPADIAALEARTTAAVAAAGPPGGVDQPPVIFAKIEMPTVVYDDPAAPRMVVVPAGEFTMGSPANEPGRAPDEGPRHRVRVGYPLAVSLYPVVYGEYALFAADTHRPSARCGAGDWRNPGYRVTVRYPATCVGYADAVAYTAWLSRKTGHRYRLLSEAEYEHVNRAGTASAYWWGAKADAGCAHANGEGREAGAAASAVACHAGIAPVNGYKPNGFGLFDTTGNIASWTADCWRADYLQAPADGSAREAKDCKTQAVRGGSWASGSLRSAARGQEPVTYAGADLGFRVAREL